MDINSELNIIAADLDIKKQVGKPENVSKAGKNALLVETAGAAQTKRLKMEKTIAGHIVIVEEHKHYNMVKCVAKSQFFGACSEEELKEHLMEQGVVDIQKVKLKRNGELLTTDAYILTFKKCECPRIIILSE